ncbi:MAG: hypothetical protein ACI8TQ_003481 [Planctomycetota bacterium]|jgi:hypothetical protein
MNEPAETFETGEVANGSTEPTLARPVKFVLFAFLIALLVFTKDGAGSWADGSRMGTIQALVEHGTLALDDTDFLWQGDKVFINGHYYSHQPPMLALVGAVPYWVLHNVFGRAITDPFTYRILTWCLVGLPLCLGLLALARLLRSTGCNANWTAVLLASAAFGTLVLPYSLVLQQHGAATGLVLLAFAAIHRRRMLVAGILLAFATTIDLTAVFPAICCAWPVLKNAGVNGVVRYGMGALPALALHFGINLSLAGDLLPIGLHLESFEYPFSPFMLMSLTGGEQRVGETAAYLWGALLGGSGFFSHHPITVLAILAGALLLLKRSYASRSTLAPGLLTAAALSSIAIAGYYLSESRNFGGSAFGMRWFTVFAPLLVLFPAVYLGQRSTPVTGHVKLLTGLLALWSIGAASLGSVQPWAKFRYFFDQRPDAVIAAQGHIPPNWTEHLKREWFRVTTFQQEFGEENYQRWFEDHIHRAGKLFSMRWDQFDDAQQSAWHREGLNKLQAIIDQLDRINDLSGCRVVGHYWLGKLHHLLGERVEAGLSYDRCLALHSSYGPAIKGRRKLAEEKLGE